LSNGTAVAWGYGANGQLGDGNTGNSSVPVAVQGLSGAKAIAGGGGHSLALLENGTVMAWGENLFGQLGNGTTTGSDVPVTVSEVSGATAIAAGESHSMALGAPLGPLPTVSSVEPASGTTHGGTSVTITGTNLTGATAVKFGATNATSFTVNSATSITAVSPAGTGTVDVTVTTPEGTSATGSADQFKYVVPAPTVTKIEPSSGPAAGGTSVTITGTNLSGATAVKFGATNATSFTVNSATSITAVSPAGTGTVDVTVTTPEGTSATSSADQFTYVMPVREPPTVTKVVPRSGPNVGGTSVEVVGTHFVEVMAVKFGSTNATSFTVKSETSITAVVPPYTGGSASVPVTVTTPGGTSSTELKGTILPEFYFRYGPTVASVSPNKGPFAGGTSVTIQGSAFESFRAADEFPPFVTAVKFGSINATSFTLPRENEILATAPAGTGTVDVTVETPGGTSPTSSADLFTYAPTVTKVEPNIGPAAGGTSVTITGTGFTGATAVQFGSNNAASFTVNSATSITAVTPAGAGRVDVTVTAAGATSSPGQEQFVYAPTVSKVEPNSGPPRGGTSVTITGTGFSGATAVKFGSASAKSFTVNSATSITAVSPKGTGTVDLTVTTPAGTNPTTAADQFTYSKK
jgi:hypothetical protein